MKRVQYLISYNLRLLERYRGYLFVASLIVLLISFLLIKWQQNLVVTTISEGIVGTFTADDLPVQVTTLLSQPFVNFDSSGKPQPGIFKDWKVNADATVYDFTVTDNLKWYDGTDVLASDMIIPVGQTTVTVKGPKTLEVKLTDSFSPLLSLLNKPAFNKASYVGTGPYYIDRIEKSQIFVSLIELKANDPHLPKVVIRFYANEETAKQALQIGEIQTLVGVNSTEDFSNQSPFKTLAKTNYAKLVSIFYNTKDPVLADKNLRLAFSFAAPSIKGQVEAKTSIAPTSWAFNNDVKDYLDNLEMAKTYLAKVQNGKDSQFVLTSTEPLEADGKAIVKQWSSFGLKTSLKVESGIPQNFQMLLITQNIPIDPDQYSLWHSTQSLTNVAQFSSPRVDKDLEDGRKTSDQAARLIAYKDFQKVLLDESPATFLYFPQFNVIYLKKIESDLIPVLKLQFPNLNF